MKRIQLLLLLLIPIFTVAQSSSNLSLVGSLEYNSSQSAYNVANDIWGYVSPDGIEYALVGLKSGFSVVSLADPANPVEMFFIEGTYTVWRDIKVWNNYAYVVSDNTSEGLLIVDLNDMTGNTYVYTTLDNNGDYLFTKAHNIFIDEFGKGYAFGGNVVANGLDGALIFDVTQTDLSTNTLPTNLGHVDQFYLHDGMVRGDTLWGAAIYDGRFYAVDVSDPANTAVFNGGLAYHSTPNEFAHNCWISDDGNTLFTTDEKLGAYVASYDVSDLSNIYELDRIQSSPDVSNVVPHNTHVLGNFLVTSYYTDGVVVHDATYPNLMIEVGHYDSYTNLGTPGEFNSANYNGCWGAYPWLPSGLILATDRNSSNNSEGVLLVLQPEFLQACYLDGTVTDALTGSTIFNASVEVLTNTSADVESNLMGYYFTGLVEAGSYDVVYSQVGYISDTITVYFDNGVLITEDVALIPTNAVFGCMDAMACNYNSAADFDDNSCTYMSVSADAFAVSCFGFSDGDISLFIDGGTTDYNIEWTDGTINNSLVSSSSSLSLWYQPAGTYTFEITDATGCTSTLEVEIDSPDPVATSDISGEIAVDATDVESYSVALIAGSTYEWYLSGGGVMTTNENNVEIEWGMDGGTYTISVTEWDGVGCMGEMVTLNVVVTAHSGVISNTSSQKKLLKVTDLLGQEVGSVNTNTPLLYMYNDGTVEKRIIME
jgi:choice-of-anchor B domain-containing protein